MSWYCRFPTPWRDGPAIQAASLRALKCGHEMRKTLELSPNSQGRRGSADRLIGYTVRSRSSRGDLRERGGGRRRRPDRCRLCPPRPNDAVRTSPGRHGSTSSASPLRRPYENACRRPAPIPRVFFIMSITGVTGTSHPMLTPFYPVAQLRATSLPVAVGFGVKSARRRRHSGKVADAVVVGSALVGAIERSLGGPMAAPLARRWRLS